MYMSQQDKQSRIFMNDILIQVNNNLDRQTKELNRLSIMPFMNEDFLDILKRRRTGASLITSFEELLAISRFNDSLMIDRNEIKGYVIFCMNGAMFESGRKPLKFNWLYEEEHEWMEAARRGEGSLVYLPSDLPQYYLDNESDKYVVSAARLIRDPTDMTELGFIKIDITSTGFRNNLYGDKSNNIFFFIYNRDNQMIYPDSMNAAFVPRGDLLLVDGDKYLVAANQSDYSELYAYMLYPYDELQQDARDITRTMITTSVLFLVLSCILCILFSNRITKPLRSLEKDFLTLSSGDFSVQTSITTNDEIGDLAEIFNYMGRQIQLLINEKYHIELNRRQAEILMLQSQINPHFLYNTLETISMNAINNDDLTTSDMVTKLGNMMRYSISTYKGLVSLRLEIQFVEEYLDLQVLRFGNKLRFAIKLDSDLEEYFIPKLILQPIVENAVIHAQTGNPLVIQLSAFINNDDLFIEITDDGIGIDQNLLECIKTNVYSESPSEESADYRNSIHKGIALKNIHQRIKLLFGNLYGITINSIKNKGTSIKIHLPLILQDIETGKRNEKGIAG
jgi:two-component system sensor histidine kinase YesM